MYVTYLYFETKYREVTYKEHSQQASLEMTCMYKFISTTTGEVISSNTLSTRTSDNIQYITYGGSQSKFYLGGTTGARRGSSGRRERDRLLSARKALKSADVLADEASQRLAGQIQTAIERELKTLIP